VISTASGAGDHGWKYEAEEPFAVWVP